MRIQCLLWRKLAFGMEISEAIVDPMLHFKALFGCAAGAV